MGKYLVKKVTVKKMTILLRIDDLNIKSMTMKTLGAAIGVTREHFQCIKAGRKGGSLKNLYYIAKALNCYPSELLPLEWQKPTEDGWQKPTKDSDIDPDILKDTMKQILAESKIEVQIKHVNN